MFASPRSQANVYRQLNAETAVLSADPHRLIAMLFEGALGALSTARGALERGDISTKAHELSRAARIVEEGLRAGLNREAGGALAAGLDSLYTYINNRILHANLRNDAAALSECAQLLQPVHEAWAAIRAQSGSAAAPLAQAYQASVAASQPAMPLPYKPLTKQFAYV